MSIFQWPVKRKQYAGINNPRFVSDLVVSGEGIIDAVTAITGLGATDFAIITGLDYTAGAPGSYAPGIFYLNGSFYYISTTTNEGLFLTGSTNDIEPQPFTDGNSRNIYTQFVGSTANESGPNTSPVLSGNMNAYRIGLKTINSNLQSVLSTIGNLSNSAFIPASATPVNGQIALWNNLLSSQQIAAAYLALSGGTMTGNLILNADPTANLGAASKQYADKASNMKLLWIGNVSADGGVITTLGPTINPLTVTVTHISTGLYKISHNIGNTNYFVLGLGINNGTSGFISLVSPRSIDTITASSFFVNLSDDSSQNDANFQLQIYAFY